NRPSSTGTTRTCCCSTARSGRWIVFSAARPMTSSSAATMRSRTISRPLAVRSTVRMRYVIAALPVVEHADDVRGQRTEQHHRERHVDVEPDLEHRPEPQVPADLRELRLAPAQQRHDALLRGTLTGEPRERAVGAAVGIAPGEPRDRTVAERVLLE